MADSLHSNARHGGSLPAEYVAGGVQWHPLTAAALIGGAVAATAGAYLGSRALARRNSGVDGRLNSTMEAAITACEVAADRRDGR